MWRLNWFRRPDLPLQITVVLEPDEGGYHAFCPGVLGVHADGRTEADALAHMADALKAYLQSLAKHGDPLPVGPHVSLARVEPTPIAMPPGALLRHVMLEWPSLQTSGAS